MEDEVPSRFEVRSGDRWFVVRVAPCKESDAQVHGAVLTFTNITAFRASLSKAIYEREYTKTILNAMIDPLVVPDDRMQVQTANRAFYDWFGASREQSQGYCFDQSRRRRVEVIRVMVRAQSDPGRES
jgi:two-component system CheB/CheR fusion protein